MTDGLRTKNGPTPDVLFFRQSPQHPTPLVLFPSAFCAPAAGFVRGDVWKRNAVRPAVSGKVADMRICSSGTRLAQPQLTSANNVHKRSSEDKWGSYEYPEQYLFRRFGHRQGTVNTLI